MKKDNRNYLQRNKNFDKGQEPHRRETDVSDETKKLQKGHCEQERVYNGAHGSIQHKLNDEYM